MIVRNKPPQYINNSGLSITVYNASRECPHFQSDTLEILMCVSGNVCAHISHGSYDLKAGDFVAINSNEVHYCTSDEDNILVSYYFDNNGTLGMEKSLNEVYIDNIWGNTDEKLVKEKKNVYLRLISILSFYLNNEMLAKADEIKTFTDELLETLVRNFQLFYVSDASSTPQVEESKERFYRIIAYLKGNYKRKITISEISSTEHISSNYLSQYVKKATLMGLTKILTFIRAHESERILLSENLSIIEVAYECGFSDPKLYYKAFKKIYNNTPNQHRIKYRELVNRASENHEIDIIQEKSVIEHYMITNIYKCI